MTYRRDGGRGRSNSRTGSDGAWRPRVRERRRMEAAVRVVGEGGRGEVGKHREAAETGMQNSRQDVGGESAWS